MKFAAFITALAFVLAGCATSNTTVGSMIPGRLTSLADGKVIPLQIEVTYGSGRMTGVDPVSGETFAGNYTAIQQTQVVQHSQPGLFGDLDAGQSVQTSDIAQASAVMVGSKGTVINFKIQVKAGDPPTGFGEAEDNHGVKYNMQF